MTGELPAAIPSRRPGNLEGAFAVRARIGSALLCTSMILAGVALFPVARLYLAAALAAYAGVLWLRPFAFLLILPVALPAFDLGIWSGWMTVTEADFFVLTTLVILLLKAPLPTTDLPPSGLARKILAIFSTSWLIAIVVGLASGLGAPASDNPLLQPDNALRLGKGFAEALVLYPFIRQRERLYNDAVSMLGWGISLGIVAVAVIVWLERTLFTDLLDFSAGYRVVGPFSSMRVGGGHIGAYLALALPMTLCLPRLQPRWIGMGLMRLTIVLGFYALAVTFARAAYAASAIGMGVAGLGWMLASRRQNRPYGMGLLPVAIVMVLVIVAASYGGMRERMVGSLRDFLAHQANWEAGLAVRDSGLATDLFGMGLGTYQRAMLVRSPVDRPSDLVIAKDADGPYLSVLVESPFFIGQKITPPKTGYFHLDLRARSAAGTVALQVSACDKVLLYSDNCRGGSVDLTGGWHDVNIAFPAEGLGAFKWWQWLARPVEFSISGSPFGQRLEVRDLHLTDDFGKELLANGNFLQGMNRWVFTDDSTVSWRMLNQYLMLLFETGGIGVVAYLALGGLAFAGGVKAAWRGAATGAAVAGSTVGFLASGLFDNVLEAPRIATLFFMVCCCGLVQWEERRQRPRPFISPSRSR